MDIQEIKAYLKRVRSEGKRRLISRVSYTPCIYWFRTTRTLCEKCENYFKHKCNWEHMCRSAVALAYDTSFCKTCYDNFGFEKEPEEVGIYLNAEIQLRKDSRMKKQELINKLEKLEMERNMLLNVVKTYADQPEGGNAREVLERIKKL